MFLAFTYFTFYDMMAVGLTPSQHLAADGGSGSTTSALVAWTLRGIISSQLGDVEIMIKEPGFKGSVKDYVELSLGYGPGMIGISTAVLVGFSLLFFAVFALSVKVLNFQKR
ncbi:hypothetical protein F0562_022087 [Nyssa sinensis]|uniref:Uncharacterized protein n=1 Tax=Nyssa sinensis TaxID=561372 RepID=A0A5J5BPL3_9ASTE|nr:hypothetical protein F0562_022087 [Nyssa sinensis]